MRSRSAALLALAMVVVAPIARLFGAPRLVTAILIVIFGVAAIYLLLRAAIWRDGSRG